MSEVSYLIVGVGGPVSRRTHDRVAIRDGRYVVATHSDRVEYQIQFQVLLPLISTLSREISDA